MLFICRLRPSRTNFALSNEHMIIRLPVMFTGHRRKPSVTSHHQGLDLADPIPVFHSFELADHSHERVSSAPNIPMTSIDPPVSEDHWVVALAGWRTQV